MSIQAVSSPEIGSSPVQDPWQSLCDTIRDDIEQAFLDEESGGIKALMCEEGGPDQQLELFTAAATRMAEWADQDTNRDLAPTFKEKYRLFLEEMSTESLDSEQMDEKDGLVYPLSYLMPEDFYHPATRSHAMPVIMSRLIRQTKYIYSQLLNQEDATNQENNKENS
jgi:hypothetical protein